jgi:hypothetical protein
VVSPSIQSINERTQKRITYLNPKLPVRIHLLQVLRPAFADGEAAGIG